MAKLIVIEGTDCSGKETQTNILIKKLKQNNIKIEKMSFPNYDSPTGKIIGGPYLGKKNICEGFFEEKATNVDPLVASLYYAADRKYNSKLIEENLKNDINMILDRYVDSNLAHQGGKYKDKKERTEFYNFINELEFNLLKLPRPDIRIFLHVPFKYVENLKKTRTEEADQHESSLEHLKNAEKTYLEICNLYNYKIINCIKNKKLRTIHDISKEIYDYVITLL